MTKDETQCSDSMFFSISVNEIERKKVGICRDIPQSWLASELEACEYPVEPIDARVSIELEKCNNGIVVRGQIVANVLVECGICLAERTLELKPTISYYLQPRLVGAETRGDTELTPEDLEREWYEGDTIALDNVMRDSIMLELPMNPRCQTDCAGLAEYYSTPLRQEVDPRLAPLASIKLQKE